MTIYVPAEETLFSYTVLEQSVVAELRELEIKNPTVKTVDDMLERIMNGTPGSELDQSLLKVDGKDSVLYGLTGGKSLLETPSNLSQGDDFNIEEFVAKELGSDNKKGEHTVSLLLTLPSSFQNPDVGLASDMVIGNQHSSWAVPATAAQLMSL